MTATPVKSESPHQWNHQRLYPLLLATVICVLIVCGTVTYQSIQRIRINSDLVAQTHENLRVLDRLESSIKDADSSQRGYIITGSTEYLEPFHNAAESINHFMQELEQRTDGDDQRQKGLETLKLLIRQKMDEMRLTITLSRESMSIAAENVLKNDTGKQFKNEIREQLTSIRSSHDRFLGERVAASDQAYIAALLTALTSTIVGLSLVAAVFWTVQDSRKKMEAATAVLFTERKRLQVTFASIGDGVVRDLTSAKKSQDEVSELASRLSEMDRRKNDFLATLAHELRNPLAPIQNAVQLMGMLKLNPEIDELRQMMARQVEQLVRLIDDLLDVSRISRGKISLRSEIVELSAIIDAAVQASSTFIAENGQQLIVNVPDDDVIRVHGDPSRLIQVISNLLNNSAKYSDSGSRIELTVVLEDQVAVISVRDNGIGIVPEMLDSIFSMFSQADDTLERRGAGLGIGLTLVKTLVELHGGTVVAQSEGVGKGSTFTVRLPAVADLSSSSTLPVIMAEAVSARSFKVLIVEDMRALRVITARLLEKLGHEVEFVENGPLALLKLDTFTPDVVFSDIAMPGMTGYELARRIRQRSDCSRVCLVALTGFGQSCDRDKALEAGFHEHMVNPVDIAVLQSLFEKLAKTVAA